MKKIEVIPCRFSDLSIQELSRVVTCYREVFAGGPWHEWKKCPICQKNYGKKDAAFLELNNYTCCDESLQDFWLHCEVEETVRLLPLDAPCFLACDGNDVVGFCWGYEIELAELEKYLGISLAHSMKKLFPYSTRIAYQSEMGILEAYRGSGIAHKLFSERTAAFIKQGLEIGVVRTRKFPEPSITHLWFSEKLLYLQIAEYPDDDGRTILAKQLKDLEGF